MVGRLVRWLVSLLFTTVRPAKTAEPIEVSFGIGLGWAQGNRLLGKALIHIWVKTADSIEMAFGMWTRTEPRITFRWGPNPSTESGTFGGFPAH